MLSRVALVNLVWVFTACATITPEGQYVQQAEQMPAAVAKQIVASYLGNAWVEKPYVYNAPLCGSHVIPLPIAQMDTALYGFNTDYEFRFGNSKGTIFSCNEGGIIIATSVTNKQQAQELLSALKALGARF
jgi:hypothetical protein